MTSGAPQTCYEGECVENFQFYLQHSGEHQAVIDSLQNFLPQEFQRIAKEKEKLDILGVGSGGGQLDVHMLTLLQAAAPATPLAVDIVDGSSELTDNFKDLVAKSPHLKDIPFAWHITPSEEYMKQETPKTGRKKFDFIHMIQMIYYVDNLDETIKFYHSLLKDNGMLMIIVDMDNGGWDILWKTHSEELCDDLIKEARSSGKVMASLEGLGLKYEEHLIPNRFDITPCFDPTNVNGQDLLNCLTEKDDFNQSFSPEIRAGILDVLRNKSSTVEDGKVTFNSNLSCIVVHT